MPCRQGDLPEVLPCLIVIAVMTETEQTAETYDVVVVGGGVAGLSGALTLVRARRTVVVIDAGEPRNAPAAAVHGFLTRDGTSPAELSEAGRAEIRGYGAQITAGRVASAARSGDGFVVTLHDGSSFGARRLLVATGLVDELPDVAGVRERWGRDVLHCPYCHGWEVRDQALGVLASGPVAVDQALLFRQWTSDLTLFLHTAPPPTDAEAERLDARGITVVGGEVASLAIIDGHLTGVRLASGELVERQAVVVGPRFVARTDGLSDLGLEMVAHPSGLGEHIAADPTGLTTVPDVWAAGNVADLTAAVSGAADAGVRVAAALNADLIAEDTRHAVAAHRGPS